MVYGFVKSIQQAVKYRGGWKGLMEHMYSVRRYLRVPLRAYVGSL